MFNVLLLNVRLIEYDVDDLQKRLGRVEFIDKVEQYRQRLQRCSCLPGLFQTIMSQWIKTFSTSKTTPCCLTSYCNTKDLFNISYSVRVNRRDCRWKTLQSQTHSIARTYSNNNVLWFVKYGLQQGTFHSCDVLL